MYFYLLNKLDFNSFLSIRRSFQREISSLTNNNPDRCQPMISYGGPKGVDKSRCLSNWCQHESSPEENDVNIRVFFRNTSRIHRWMEKIYCLQRVGKRRKSFYERAHKTPTTFSGWTKHHDNMMWESVLADRRNVLSGPIHVRSALPLPAESGTFGENVYRKSVLVIM